MSVSFSRWRVCGIDWRRRVAGSRGRQREMELRQWALWSCDSSVPRLGRPQWWCRLETTNACSGVPALWAKALARFILVKWRWCLRASLSLLRASFWSCNPPTRGLWVKTRSSSWTSDGGACGRRDLLGGVVSRDTVWRLGRPATRDLLRPVVTILSDGVRRRGLPTSRQDACSSVGGRGSALSCCSPACSVPRCLELRGSLQCGAGQRLKDGASGNDNQ